MNNTKENPSKAVELIRMAEEMFDIYADQHGEPFAWSKNPGRVYLLRTREFRSVLAREFYERFAEAPSSIAIKAALNVIESKALAGERYHLSNRVAGDSKKILIDIGVREEKAITVTPESWTEAALDRPMFRRYGHMQRFGPPGEHEADLRDLMRFFKLSDPNDEVLIVGFIGAALVPDIPHPMLLLLGPQGATKTTLLATIRQLIDPSSLKTLALSRKEDELAQQLSHNYFAAFDNVGQLKPWQADTLCRAVTGEGFTKRRLYSDEEDIIFAYRRIVAMSAINVPSFRGDVLDRALIVKLARVARSERRPDREVQEFITAKIPGVLRQMLNALVTAMSTTEAVRKELHELPRMADFVVWGEAFCRAVGYEPGTFSSKFVERTEDAASVALENDIVADLILKFMAGEGADSLDQATTRWHGTASELLNELKEINERLHYVSEKELPANPRKLSLCLGELEANLADYGAKIDRSREGKQGKRMITISMSESVEKGREVSSAASASSANSEVKLGSDSPKKPSISEGNTADAADAGIPPLAGAYSAVDGTPGDETKAVPVTDEIGMAIMTQLTKDVSNTSLELMYRINQGYLAVWDRLIELEKDKVIVRFSGKQNGYIYWKRNERELRKEKK